jgi:hypothetical protein
MNCDMPDLSQPAPDRREATIAAVVFGLLLGFHVWGVSVGWNNGNLPGNDFRQTQTAMTALFVQREHNFALAYPTPVLGKPWSIPFEFPLYQWTVVVVSDATGMPLTQAGRAVSAGCFYLALPAAWLLLGRLGLGRSRRLVVLGMVVTCPLYVFYARAFLIETMALMFSLWFLHAFVTAVERRSWGWLVVANVAGVGAGLVKVTTFMLYLMPAGIWAAPGRDREERDGAGAHRRLDRGGHDGAVCSDLGLDPLHRRRQGPQPKQPRSRVVRDASVQFRHVADALLGGNLGATWAHHPQRSHHSAGGGRGGGTGAAVRPPRLAVARLVRRLVLRGAAVVSRPLRLA